MLSMSTKRLFARGGEMDIDATRIRVAYMLGRRAFEYMHDIEENPIDRWLFPEAWRAWQDGFLDAEDEDRRRYRCEWGAM